MAGDQGVDDLKWLIAREISHLRRFAIALTRDEILADDLVQDSLERALKKRRQWSQRGSLRSWLFRVLYRIHLDHRRNRWSRLVPASEADLDRHSMESPQQEHHIACRDIGEAIGRLPADQRSAILLIALEGMSYDQAAVVLDIPIGTLRSRLSRARQRLAREWVGPGEHTWLRRVK